MLPMAGNRVYTMIFLFFAGTALGGLVFSSNHPNRTVNSTPIQVPVNHELYRLRHGQGPHRKCRSVSATELASLLRMTNSPVDLETQVQRTTSREKTAARVVDKDPVLVKRRLDQERVFRLVFHYACPETQVAAETFFLRVKYSATNDQVTFHNVRDRLTFRNVEQEDRGYHGVIDYDGFVYATLRHHLYNEETGHHRLCIYRYRAFVEGEVYLSALTAMVVQPRFQDEFPNMYAPKVTEECFIFFWDKDGTHLCPERDEPFECTVHNVETTTAGG